MRGSRVLFGMVAVACAAISVPLCAHAADVVELCEAEIAKRLVAPATYRQIERAVERRPMSIDAWVDAETIAIRDANLQTPDRAVAQRQEMRDREASWRASGIIPERETASIVFDAQNRRMRSCSYVAQSAKQENGAKGHKMA